MLKFSQENAKKVLTAIVKYANIITVARNGEVVELVYGTSLENWRAFVAYRGFESHPLRQNKVRYKNKYLTFIRIMEMYPSGEGDCLLNS